MLSLFLRVGAFSCILGLCSTLNATAQDKAGRFRAFYALPHGYKLHYLTFQAKPDKTKTKTATLTDASVVPPKTTKITTTTVTQAITDTETETVTTTDESVKPPKVISTVTTVSNVPGVRQAVAAGTQEVNAGAWWQVLIGRRVRFSVKVKGDSLYFSPWKFTAGEPTGPNEINNTTTKAGRLYEVIGETTAEGSNGRLFKVPFRAYDFGVLVIPGRVYIPRGSKNRDWLPSISSGAGAYLGINFGYTNFFQGGTTKNVSLLPITYLGASTISVTTTNTDPAVAEKSTEAGLTWGGGFLFGRDDLTIGVICGRDFGLTPTARKWNYARAAYFGAVISLKIEAFK